MELSQERQEARETYRQRIMQFISGLAVATQAETPMLDIGMDDEVIS